MKFIEIYKNDKENAKNKNIISDILLLVVIIVFMVTYIMLKIFTTKSKNILLNYAENKTKELSLYLVNDAVSRAIKKDDIEINNLIEIEKNEENEIVSVNFNNIKINEITTIIGENIQTNLRKMEQNKKNKIMKKYYEDDVDIIYKVPMSIVYDVPILVGIGPKIPFKLDVLGNINIDAITNVKEYGINNSLIESYLKIKINIQIILPFTSKKIITENKVPLITKTIQGKIPEYYNGGISNKN